MTENPGMSDRTYRSPLLDRPGAVPADQPDAGVAAHYGDPLGEQRRLTAGDGWVDLSHRDVVRIEGPDRHQWLNDLTTQRLKPFESGASAEALVLSPQGHVEHHLSLVDDGDATWAHVEPGEGASLVEFLESMRFMLRVEVADVTADWAIVWQPASAPVPRRLLNLIETAPGWAGGHTLFLRRGTLDGLDGEPAGATALEALRIEAGQPRFGVDTDHRAIPHEVGWIGTAVQLNKGCYRGQETVARVANLGRPPRRLVRLHLDGSVRETLPATATPVFAGGEKIGTLTSSAYHHELGPIALALVKYATADDIDVVVGSDDDGVAARLEAVVERDDTPRPGQAARAAFRRSLL